MNTSDPSNAFFESCRSLWLTAWLLLLTQAGCTSAITTAAMREAFNVTMASLATPLPHAADRDPASDEEQHEPAEEAEAIDADADEEAPAVAAKPKLTLDQAVERAVSRLSAAGQLDAATQATLLAMLESTNPEDWPAAIDAFTASLEANRPAIPAQPAAAPAPDDSVSQTEPMPEPVAEPVPPTLPAPVALPAPVRKAVAAPAEVAAVVIEPVSHAAEQATIEPEPESQPEDPADAPVAPALAVRNPCFVTKVKAWGAVDRFPTQVFRHGQDVIVYFELEQLSCRSDAAGHSTSIDTAFRLVGADGAQIRTWTFEPVDETCLSQRRDYFARYFLRIPDNAPAGPCRLEFIVTDRLAGASTQSHLDLEIDDRP
jgi:hypothetical protein